MTNGARPEPDGTPSEVFGAFLKLGLTAFGGPVAHLGYFRAELVTRRRWLDDAAYADLVALCQFLPGPASSQVGFALGLIRAGPLGAVAAWTAFTLPSAILLVLFAYGAPLLSGPVGTGLVAGLKIAAIAIVAQAVTGMARSLTPDLPRILIAAAAAVLVLAAGHAGWQLAAILLGALAGLAICRTAVPPPAEALRPPVSRWTALAALALFAILLVALPLAASGSIQWIGLFDAFYRAGALVFGGGHVVLPLLDATTVARGWISEDAFLAGYGAAQAVPGPLFTFAAYLGALVGPAPNGVPGAAIALVAIFLPGLLLVVGALPFWHRLRTLPRARAALAGANASVVGILAAALWDPVITSSVAGPWDALLAILALVLLMGLKAPPILVVALAALAGALGALL